MPRSAIRRALYAAFFSCLAVAIVGYPVLAVAQVAATAAPVPAAFPDLGVLGPLIGGGSGVGVVAVLFWLIREERAERREVIGKLDLALQELAKAQRENTRALERMAEAQEEVAERIEDIARAKVGA